MSNTYFCSVGKLIVSLFCWQFKTVSMEKGQTSDRARDEYKNQLDKANSKQTLHYSSEMPAVFDVSHLFLGIPLCGVVKLIQSTLP